MNSNKEAEILFKLIETKYSDKLDNNELEEIKKTVLKIVETSEELRSVVLENWDEPFSVFIPFREDKE
jgi:hypothetical protein